MNAVSAIGTLFSGIDFQSRQGMAVARLTLDHVESQGKAAVDMIRAAAKVSNEAGERARTPIGPSGHNLDVYA